jgi:hypothetical protein
MYRGANQGWRLPGQRCQPGLAITSLKDIGRRVSPGKEDAEHKDAA